MNVLKMLSIVLMAFRHFMSQAVIDALKNAAAEAVTKTDWSHGQRTAFVIEAGRAVVAATPNPWDDLLYEAAASLYVRKYAAKVTAAADADAQASSSPV